MSKKRTERDSASEKREKIRKAAYRSFRDKGYHHTTVDAICKRAQTSKGSFYWHYDSKQEVFLDILDTWSREVAEEVLEQFEGAVLENNNLPAIAIALQREARRGRSIVPLWLEFAVYSRDDRELQKGLAQFFGRIRESIGKMLQPALGTKISSSEIEALSATIFGAYSGLIIQELCDPLNVDSGKLVSRFLAVLHQGLHSSPTEQNEGSDAVDHSSTPSMPDVSTPHLSEERKRAQS